VERCLAALSAFAFLLVFIALEHGMEDEFAKNVMKTDSKDDSVVPHWPGKDFDSIFVIRLVYSGAATTATFTWNHQGLDGRLSDRFPVPANPG
jgi:hypothetical protein